MSGGGDDLHAAFASVSEAFAELEAHLIGSQSLSEAERADGYRFILGLQKWVTDRYFQGFDRARPRFVRYGDDFSRWGASNPDNAYWIAEISGDREYRLQGRRGTAADLVIETRTGIGRQEDGTHSRTIDALDAGNLRVEADGSYEIRIGGPERPGNHLATGEAAQVVFVRQTFSDWDREEAGPFWIESADPVEAPKPPGPAEMARTLGDVGRFLTFLGKINADQALEFRAGLKLNAFPKPGDALPVKSKGGVAPGQSNAFARFALAQSQAMIVTIEPPECRYLGFCVAHPYWFAPLDFANRQCSLTLSQARRSGDGRVRYVISARDPGLWNWIDCAGLEEGFMFFRCQGLTGEFRTPAVEIVAFETLGRVMADDEPRATPAERAEVLRRRRLAVHRRYL